MQLTDQSNPSTTDNSRVKGLSRRQFLKLTGSAVVGCMAFETTAIPGLANAEGFIDYWKYDGLGPGE